MGDVPTDQLQLATMHVNNWGYLVFDGSSPRQAMETSKPKTIYEFIEEWKEGWLLADSFSPWT